IARMRAASRRASSGVSTTAMPPALPRPPIGTWALTATLPSSRAAAAASSGVRASLPGGTGMPAAPNRCLAWYSSSFIGARSHGGRVGSSAWRDPVELGEVVSARAPASCPSVGSHLLRRRCPGDHRYDLRLRGETPDRDIEHGDATLAGEPFQGFDDVEIEVGQPSIG